MRFGQSFNPTCTSRFPYLEQRSECRGQGVIYQTFIEDETGPFKNLATLVHDPYFMQE